LVAAYCASPRSDGVFVSGAAVSASGRSGDSFRGTRKDARIFRSSVGVCFGLGVGYCLVTSFLIPNTIGYVLEETIMKQQVALSIF